jgi:hypothetical protein
MKVGCEIYRNSAKKIFLDDLFHKVKNENWVKLAQDMANGTLTVI